MKKQLIGAFVLLSTLSTCFAFSDNNFNGVTQYATADPIRHIVAKKILVIQNLEKGEKAKSFHCLIKGGNDAVIYQNGFEWPWHSQTIEMRHIPGINITFLSDDVVVKNSITKTLTIATADMETITGICYYLYQ